VATRRLSIHHVHLRRQTFHRLEEVALAPVPPLRETTRRRDSVDQVLMRVSLAIAVMVSFQVADQVVLELQLSICLLGQLSPTLGAREERVKGCAPVQALTVEIDMEELMCETAPPPGRHL